MKKALAELAKAASEKYLFALGEVKPEDFAEYLRHPIIQGS